MSILRKIIYSILSFQEKILTKKLQKTLEIKNSSKRKQIYNKGCFLSLDSIADSEKNKMEEELSLILKTSNYNPLEVLEYIKSHGTEVFFIEKSNYLSSIGENEGFLYPQKGFRALYLSLLTKKQVSFNTPEMFVLTKGSINKYYFIYHFYNWYAFKHGIFGINTESNELLKQYLFDSSSENINKLQLADIYKLKDAIKQDKSAIEFVFKLCQQYEGAKNALNKLKDDGANI